MQTSPEERRTYQSIRVDDGPKLILVDRGRVIDEIKLGKFDTRTIKTHQGHIQSVRLEETTYYTDK